MMFADSLHPPAHAKALIFDCDGTLADTFAAHYGAFRAALAPYGIDFGTDFYAVRLGWSRKALLEAVVQETGVPFDAEAVAARNAPLFLDHIDAVRAIAATEALVRGYYGKMRLGVCSGGQKDIVEATLKAIGLYDCFCNGRPLVNPF